MFALYEVARKTWKTMREERKQEMAASKQARKVLEGSEMEPTPLCCPICRLELRAET